MMVKSLLGESTYGNHLGISPMVVKSGLAVRLGCLASWGRLWVRGRWLTPGGGLYLLSLLSSLFVGLKVDGFGSLRIEIDWLSRRYR